MRKSISLILYILCALIPTKAKALDIKIGAYYFDGWATDKSSAFTDKLLIQFPEREPIWGWRDDDIKIMERQIDVASKNGIDFFAFCWYWADDHGAFNEKAVRAKPAHTSLDLFLKAKNKSKMEFCIMIANHDGARIDGGNNWKNAIDYFADNYFLDPQYLRIENKPVVIYFLPIDAQPFIPAMRKEAIEKGYKGLFTMSCGYGLDGYDALTWYNSFESIKQSEPHDYKELTTWIENTRNKASPKYQVAPLCSAGWDKRPWEKTEKTAYYVNRTTDAFRMHLYNAVDYIYKRKPVHPIIMIYAWNEYGEGGYIAPTKGDKYGRLLKQVKKTKKYAKRKK